MSSPWWRTILEFVLILAVFAIHGGWPVPDDNEAHYLTKAKHYWDPSFAEGDFFLESADAHEVFYWSFGWLSQLLSFTALAWVGRFIVWALMAFSWRMLSWSVLPKSWFSVLSAALFVLLTERYHMAGEWVVGGIEAKGFAYALVFFGLACVVRNRWNAAWVCLGAASAFHVLVGGWATAAAMISWLLNPKDREPFLKMLPGGLVGLFLALIGLVPALALTHGVEPSVVHEANRIYVYERLPHHLVPSTFRVGFVGRHLLLIVFWVALCSLIPATPPLRRFRACIAAAVVFATIGFGIAAAADATTSESLDQTLTTLLRYYWFRLSDALIPVGFALNSLVAIGWLSRSRLTLARMWLVVACIAGGGYLMTRFVEAPLAEVPRGDKNVAYDDWRAACDWIARNTPSNATILGPRLASSITWYSSRPDVVNWKNVPQDAPGIVEWWERMCEIFENPNGLPTDRWYNCLAEAGSDHVARVANKYGATYIVMNKDPELDPLPWEPEFENTSYYVYRVPRS